MQIDRDHKIMNIKKPLATAVFLLCVGCFAQLLIAQEEGESSLVLEEVILTATRAETTLMKTPILISAFEQNAGYSGDDVR